MGYDYVRTRPERPDTERPVRLEEVFKHIDELNQKVEQLEQVNQRLDDLTKEFKKIEEVINNYSIIHKTIIDLQASGRIGKILLRFLTWILGIGAALATMAVWLNDRAP